MENEKQLYRILAQKEGFTATIETKEITFQEVKEVAMKQVKMIDEDLNFKPFVVLPITTQDRYETGCINFCPRCGTNITDYALVASDSSDCHECGASFYAVIVITEEEG